MSLPVPSVGNGIAGMQFDPKEQEAIDNILVALASRSGGDLRKLLHSFFSFLHRRTDFYIVPHEDDVHSKMGFREGDAEKVLLAAFRQFPLRKMPRQADIEAAKNKGPQKDPEEAKELATPKASEPKSTKKVNADKDDQIRLTEDGLQIPVGNGGTTSKYKWTQTIEECTVLINVPVGIRGKELDVKITSSGIEVKPKKPLEDGTTVFVEGPLTEDIDPGESTWSLEGGVVVLVLYKKQKKFWETIIKGDSKIDTSMVDSRRNISEYDETTQAQIRKMIFDQNQAQKGLPTSDEITGTKPPIPPLPPGVEYINQEKLDEVFSGSLPPKKVNNVNLVHNSYVEECRKLGLVGPNVLLVIARVVTGLAQDRRVKMARSFSTACSALMTMAAEKVIDSRSLFFTDDDEFTDFTSAGFPSAGGFGGPSNGLNADKNQESWHDPFAGLEVAAPPVVLQPSGDSNGAHFGTLGNVSQPIETHTFQESTQLRLDTLYSATPYTTTVDSQVTDNMDDDEFGDFGGPDDVQTETLHPVVDSGLFELGVATADPATLSMLQEDETEFGEFDGAQAAEVGEQVEPALVDDDDDFGEFGGCENAEAATANTMLKQEVDIPFGDLNGATSGADNTNGGHESWQDPFAGLEVAPAPVMQLIGLGGVSQQIEANDFPKETQSRDEVTNPIENGMLVKDKDNDDDDEFGDFGGADGDDSADGSSEMQVETAPVVDAALGHGHVTPEPATTSAMSTQVHFGDSNGETTGAESTYKGHESWQDPLLPSEDSNDMHFGRAGRVSPQIETSNFHGDTQLSREGSYPIKDESIVGTLESIKNPMEMQSSDIPIEQDCKDDEEFGGTAENLAEVTNVAQTETSLAIGTGFLYGSDDTAQPAVTTTVSPAQGDETEFGEFDDAQVDVAEEWVSGQTEPALASREDDVFDEFATATSTIPTHDDDNVKIDDLKEESRETAESGQTDDEDDFGGLENDASGATSQSLKQEDDFASAVIDMAEEMDESRVETAEPNSLDDKDNFGGFANADLETTRQSPKHDHFYVVPEHVSEEWIGGDAQPALADGHASFGGSDSSVPAATGQIMTRVYTTEQSAESNVEPETALFDDEDFGGFENAETATTNLSVKQQGVSDFDEVETPGDEVAESGEFCVDDPAFVDDANHFGEFGGLGNAEPEQEDDTEFGEFDGVQEDIAKESDESRVAELALTDDDFGDFGSFENAEPATPSQLLPQEDDTEFGDFDGAQGNMTEEPVEPYVQPVEPALVDDDDDFGDFGGFESAEPADAATSNFSAQEDDGEFGDFDGQGQAVTVDTTSQMVRDVAEIKDFADRASSIFQNMFAKYSRELEIESVEDPSAEIVSIGLILKQELDGRSEKHTPIRLMDVLSRPGEAKNTTPFAYIDNRSLNQSSQLRCESWVSKFKPPSAPLSLGNVFLPSDKSSEAAQGEAVPEKHEER